MNQVAQAARFYSLPPLTTWGLINAYWQSEERLQARVQFFIITLVTILLVGFDVAISYWYNYFYDAVQAYNKSGVIYLLLGFCVIATFFIIFAVLRFYILQTFGLRWRAWLTKEIVNRWLSNRSYYLLENFDESTDNPDQRIQEDIASLVTSSLTLSVGLISAATTFLAFIYILWKLSGVMTLPLGPLGVWRVPGYLVWMSIFYSILGTYLTFKIGRPLTSLNFEQQRREANFRFAAVNLRSHAEHVALYHGEQQQADSLFRLFKRVLNNWYAIIIRQKQLLWFTAGYNQAAVVLPLVVVLPNYFNKVFLLGGFMQSLKAFSTIQDSLSFMVNAYTQFAEWQAVNARLTTFINHMNSMDKKLSQEKQVLITKKTENEIKLSSLRLENPEHRILMKDINETFLHGKHYLIKGPSGIGKSTLIRTIAGIWPYASGQIDLPLHQQIMYLPQKPYMPLGTLAEALLFPDGQQSHQEEQLKQVLSLCQLDQFIPHLNQVSTWSQQLSPGEQQRLTFARILLKQPDWVFLDESTSMLDMASEKALYNLIKSHLPKCSIISVGHRTSLDAFHDHIMLFDALDKESKRWT